MEVRESGEMYLENILIISEKKENVRAIDIVEYMGYSKPSVSRAMSLLREGGYITVDKNGYITLTPAGTEVAEKVYAKHKILEDMLVYLGVDREIASIDACKMEHVISEETFLHIKDFMKKNNASE